MLSNKFEVHYFYFSHWWKPNVTSSLQICKTNVNKQHLFLALSSDRFHCYCWLRITERIEYKLLSLTYKVLTTTQPPYLHKLISTQRPHSTRSLSVVTLARLASSSSLKITDRSFRYASPCLWNQLPFSLRKPHSGTSSSISCSPIPSAITSSSSDSPLCTSIMQSLIVHCCTSLTVRNVVVQWSHWNIVLHWLTNIGNRFSVFTFSFRMALWQFLILSRSAA